MNNSWGNRLLLAIGREGKLLSHQADTSRGEGYFHFIPQNGSRCLFIKTLRSDRLKSQINANRIVEQLADNALPVSPLLESYPRRIDNKYSLFAYNLIDGRFSHTTKDDLTALGRLIGRTHNALRALPWASQIRKKSTQRNERVTELRVRALESLDKQSVLHQTLSQSNITLSDSHGQALHGDLNMGNIFFGKASGQPALLDLEDANHNWHNPIVDIAMLIERFVLVPESDDEKAFELGCTLLRGYQSTHSNALKWDQPACDILQTLSTRSLSLLLNSTHKTNQNEINKFISLSQQAKQRKSLLIRLWDFAKNNH